MLRMRHKADMLPMRQKADMLPMRQKADMLRMRHKARDGIKPFVRGGGAFKPYYELCRHADYRAKPMRQPTGVDAYPVGAVGLNNTDAAVLHLNGVDMPLVILNGKAGCTALRILLSKP